MEREWTMSGCFRAFFGLLLFGVISNLHAETAKTDALREKAAAGDAESAFYLGNEYFYGENRMSNYTLAAYWYKKAAEQGDADAQNSLGACYLLGLGVPKNEKEAANLFRKAADQGEENAKKYLEAMKK